MAKNVTQAIDRWFADRKNDGEFVRNGREYAYTFIPPARRNAPIIYTTKRDAFAAGTAKQRSTGPFGVIGRYGLPDKSDVPSIRRLVADHKLFFLGDLDPQDLLVYVWLRAGLRQKEIQFLGVSDSYLEKLKVVIPDTFVMHCSASERRSMALLTTVFPDLEQVVGKRCHELLSDGRKIELEAVVSALDGASSILPPRF